MTDVGESVAATPAGAPVTLSAMFWAVPEVVAVETVDVADPPAVTVLDVGESPTEKSLVTGPPTMACAI